MKVLQVITSLRTGGAEKLITDMVPIYRQQGIDVDVLLFDGIETAFKKQLEEQRIHIIEFGRNKSVYSPIHIIKLIRYLRSHTYDWVHTHNTACQLFAAIASMFTPPPRPDSAPLSTTHQTAAGNQHCSNFSTDGCTAATA